MEPAIASPAMPLPISQINMWFDATSCLELEFCGNYFALDASDRAFIAKLETMFRGHASAGGEDEPQVDAAPPIDAKPDPWVCRKCGAEVAPTVMSNGAGVIVHACNIADATEPPNEPPGLAYRHCRSCGVRAPTPVSEAVDVDEPWTCANCHVDDAEAELKPPAGGL